MSDLHRFCLFHRGARKGPFLIVEATVCKHFSFAIGRSSQTMKNWSSLNPSTAKP